MRIPMTEYFAAPHAAVTTDHPGRMELKNVCDYPARSFVDSGR